MSSKAGIEALGQRSAETVAALRDLRRGRARGDRRGGAQAIPPAASDDQGGRLAAMNNWSTEDVDRRREPERGYIVLARGDDLADNYIAPYIQARPGDFPQTIDQL